jgi:hypothetical protein
MKLGREKDRNSEGAIDMIPDLKKKKKKKKKSKLR